MTDKSADKPEAKEYRPLPPAMRRINEIAQFMGSVSLLASVFVIGFFFFFGTEDTAGYRFDSTHGWAYLGTQGEQEAFEFELLPHDESARIDKGVVVRKKVGGVYLRPEPYYPFYAVIGSWFGFDRDAAVKGYVPTGTCAKVNALTKTGFDSLWIHITIVDDAVCGGPRPEPPPAQSESPASDAPGEDGEAPRPAPADDAAPPPM
jgi:hypothetical protein